MTLKERFQAAESELGKILIKVGAFCLAVISVYQAGEYAEFIPAGFIPDWVKGAIGLLALSGAVAGKFTVATKEDGNQH